MARKLETTPAELRELYDQYASNQGAYRGYKEANIRSEFLDRLFKSLGWDVANDRGLPPSQREVVVEPSLDDEKNKRAPDYAFLFDRREVFYVEAKPSHLTVKNDRNAAFQARSYGWTARHPLVVLTNFEEVAVYDCRFRPEPGDPADHHRENYLSLDENGPVEVCNFLWSRLSKTAVTEGSFAQLVLHYERKKKGTRPVDEAFLDEIGSWRVMLAADIAAQNTLSQAELNQAIQLMVDRLVFLRICEDREIEEFFTLQKVRDGGKQLDPNSVLVRLKQTFSQAEARFDSGLFHFEGRDGDEDTKDRITPGLRVSDDVLRRIISRLYFPESPYAFRKLPGDILGQVYEQFLGRIVEVRSGSVQVVEKPEVKKANGVVYTPDYIVREIVSHCLQAAVTGATPDSLGAMRILDPACGSGTFLIEAYQFLLDWYLDSYAKSPRKHSKAGRLDTTGPVPRLTLAERKRILRLHIFGVDLDPQATEVTKLSLALKLLEGESNFTVRNELRFNSSPALPDLDTNVKCGNSLLDFSFFDRYPASLTNPDAPQPNSPFDWKSGFPEAFEEGGFDVVIGNPPYIDLQTMKKWAKADVNYYQEIYETSRESNPDIYVAFVERSLQLLRPRGRLGFILPHKFFTAKYGAPLRRILCQGKFVERIVHFGSLKVFPKRSVYPCLLFLQKEPHDELRFTKVLHLGRWRRLGEGLHGTVPSGLLTAAEWNIVVGPSAPIFYRLHAMPDKLSGAGDVFVGLQTSADPVFVFTGDFRHQGQTITVHSEAKGAEIDLEAAILRPVVRSGVDNIGRFRAKATAWVLFPYEKIGNRYRLIPAEKMQANFPLAWAYLVGQRTNLEKREEGKFAGDGWYQLYPKNLDEWDEPKAMIPYMVRELSAYHDSEGGKFFVNVTTGGFGFRSNGSYGSTAFITGVLNSDLLSWFASKLGSDFQSGYMGINKQFLDQVPLPDPRHLGRHAAECAELEQLTTTIQQQHVALDGERASHTRAMLQRRLEAAQLRANQIVYSLYGIGRSEVTQIEMDLAEVERLRADDSE